VLRDGDRARVDGAVRSVSVKKSSHAEQVCQNILKFSIKIFDSLSCRTTIDLYKKVSNFGHTTAIRCRTTSICCRTTQQNDRDSNMILHLNMPLYSSKCDNTVKNWNTS
jgi:hypothetical protein